MPDPLLDLHTKHIEAITSASTDEEKLTLIKKLAKELIASIDEKDENQVLDVGTYIYGMTYSPGLGFSIDFKNQQFMRKLTELAQPLEAYGMSPDGNIKKYWGELKKYIKSL